MDISSITKFHISKGSFREEETIKSDNGSLEPLAVNPNLFHVTMGTYAFILLFLLSWVYPYVFFGFSLVSLVVLFFDALFVFLVFPLTGSLFYKIFLLAAGHGVGFVWEFFLAFITANLTHYCGDGFDCLYVVICPFFELFWVVSMWAFGLSVLVSVKRRG